ncbi:hypothetical protein [Halorubrum coriense]|uniref:hypothetical protein n=1 Tax=Halorubrum coriense TaxID=64713 RepID=UPI00126836BE|nr:hypothetical protein [Halorubrum coriense]
MICDILTNELVIRILGMTIYGIGGVIIAVPGIIHLERLYGAGKLLRGIEKLEAGKVEENQIGFDKLVCEINEITGSKCQIGDEVSELELYVGTTVVGGKEAKGPELTIKGYDRDGNEAVHVDEPIFERLRYIIDRKVRRGKTKIRTGGLLLILVGFSLQLRSLFM